MPQCFPTPHTDESNSIIDLNALLINRNTSFLFRMQGDSMAGAGIYDGDILIVDRSVKPRHDHIVLAVLDGQHMFRQLYKRGREIRLVSDGPDIELREGQELQVFGVVTVRIRQFA